jgi:L-histidine N-alpha-methyltransferase
VDETAYSADCLNIHYLAADSNSNTFAEDVRAGLTSNPKTLPPKYFYDELGSHLFEAICCLPEYYLARAESEILRARADEIIHAATGSAQGEFRLIELGSGSAEKTRFLIQALLRRQSEVHYLPVDISATSLTRSAEKLLGEYPRLRVTGYCGDYLTALRTIFDAGSHGERNIMLFLGSNIGNFDPAQSRSLLSRVRSVLNRGDALLIGADLKKDPSLLVPAYDDSLGVTACFNLNILLRINRELGGDFDLTRFKHRAIYNEQLSRIEMHLISRQSQSAQIRAINLKVSFEQGESIHTENSYKFDLEQLSELARGSGFSLEETWQDSASYFSFNLFTAV